MRDRRTAPPWVPPWRPHFPRLRRFSVCFRSFPLDAPRSPEMPQEAPEQAQSKHKASTKQSQSKHRATQSKSRHRAEQSKSRQRANREQAESEHRICTEQTESKHRASRAQPSNMHLRISDHRSASGVGSSGVAINKFNLAPEISAL